MYAAAYQRVVFNFRFAQLQTDIMLYRYRLDRADNTVYHFTQIERLVFKLDLAGFELVHVEYVVYKLEQESGGFIYFVSAFLLPFLVALAVTAYFYHSAYAVYRCAQVMTHAAKKVCL